MAARKGDGRDVRTAPATRPGRRYPRMTDASGKCRLCLRNDRQGVPGWFERNLCLFCAAQTGRADRKAGALRYDKPASANSSLARRRK